jgi:hypothetical protein
MAQTRKRRRRKHRGTQGGRVDHRRTGRPRSRQEARDRARSSRRGPRADSPPTWRGAVNRGLVAAAIFVLLLLLAFRRPFWEAFGFGAFMLVFYIPMGYYIDRIMWRRRQGAKVKDR